MTALPQNIAELSARPERGLEISGLSVSFASAGAPLLEDFSLTARTGEVVAILGRSGCGKSTLLNTIAGVIRPRNGRLEFDGRPLDEARGARRISYLNQKPLLLPWLSVRNNVVAPTRLAGRSLGNPVSLLERLGLGDRLDAYPGTLSGGMYQRAALARALFVDPALLLMDEPFSALDEITRIEAYGVLREIARERRICCLLVTHDISEAFLAADRCIVLKGKPVSIGLDAPVSGLDESRDADLLQLRSRILELLR